MTDKISLGLLPAIPPTRASVLLHDAGNATGTATIADVLGLIIGEDLSGSLGAVISGITVSPFGDLRINLLNGNVQTLPVPTPLGGLDFSSPRQSLWLFL